MPRDSSEVFAKALERRKHKLATIYLWQEEDGTFGATWDWGGTWDWSTSGEALQQVTDALSEVRHVDSGEFGQLHRESE